MTFRYLLAATALILSSSANASVINKKYQIVSTFTSGPLKTVTNTFEYSFDPDVSDSAKLLSFTSSGNDSFQVAPQAVYNPSTRSFIIGDARPSSITALTTDFALVLYLGKSGNVQESLLQYAMADQKKVFYSNSDALTALEPSPISVTSAVPEPATWALMLAGFGLTGAALRRRFRTIGARIVA